MSSTHSAHLVNETGTATTIIAAGGLGFCTEARADWLKAHPLAPGQELRIVRTVSITTTTPAELVATQ